MKEIKEIYRFACCEQPVPKALSVISCVPLVASEQSSSAVISV